MNGKKLLVILSVQIAALINIASIDAHAKSGCLDITGNYSFESRTATCTGEYFGVDTDYPNSLEMNGAVFTPGSKLNIKQSFCTHVLVIFENGVVSKNNIDEEFQMLVDADALEQSGAGKAEFSSKEIKVETTSREVVGDSGLKNTWKQEKSYTLEEDGTLVYRYEHYKSTKGVKSDKESYACKFKKIKE